MPLDPVSLAAFAAPILAKGAEAFTKTAGEKMGGKMIDLCQAVVEKFKGDGCAEQALARAKEMPESEERQLALKGILLEMMNNDPNFLDKVLEIFVEVKRKDPSICVIFDQKDQIVCTQTNFGNVNGPVNIGSN